MESARGGGGGAPGLLPAAAATEAYALEGPLNEGAAENASRNASRALTPLLRREEVVADALSAGALSPAATSSVVAEKASAAPTAGGPVRSSAPRISPSGGAAAGISVTVTQQIIDRAVEARKVLLRQEMVSCITKAGLSNSALFISTGRLSLAEEEAVNRAVENRIAIFKGRLQSLSGTKISHTATKDPLEVERLQTAIREELKHIFDSYQPKVKFVPTQYAFSEDFKEKLLSRVYWLERIDPSAEV